jgi:hypothetical protein
MNIKGSLFSWADAATAAIRLAIVGLICGGVQAQLWSPPEVMTVETLSHWSATGGDATVSAPQGTVTIPQRAQIYRHYPAGVLEVRLVSRPYFSSTPAGAPLLGVGPANLTFVREVGGGGLVLLGDEPLALPFELPLDDAGRSREPLDLSLIYDPASAKASLRINGTVFDVAATAAPQPVEVAVSAGEVTAWAIERLEVRTSVPEFVPASSAARRADEEIAESTTAGLSPAERARLRNQATADAKRMFLERVDAAAEKVLTRANRNPLNSAEWHMESANALVHMAFAVSRAGRPEKAVALAERALEHIELAIRKAARQPGQDALAANAEKLAGFVREKLLADQAGAREYYHRAALRYPRGGAGKQLDRLDEIEREAGRRAAGRSTGGGKP